MDFESLRFLSDGELESLLLNHEQLDDDVMSSSIRSELHLRELGCDRDKAVAAASAFGLMMHGYMSSSDPEFGYLVTDRKITQTTFCVKTLCPSDIAKKYVIKLKTFYPDDWKCKVFTMANQLESPYKEIMLGELCPN